MQDRRSKISALTYCIVFVGLTIVSCAFMVACYATVSERMRANQTSLVLSVGLAVLVMYKSRKTQGFHRTFFMLLAAVNLLLVALSVTQILMCIR
jgi:hypothetical protein